MQDNGKNRKNQVINEEFDSDYTQDQEQEKEPVQKGTYSKPIILQHMVESFDSFRIGMDKLTGVYTTMETSDPALYQKMSRFGEAFSKLMEGFAKLIEQQGGSVEPVTKPKALQTYFGNQGMDALGMNESKEAVFNARVDLNIDRIKNIMSNSRRK